MRCRMLTIVVFVILGVFFGVSNVWAKKPINTNWWGVAVKGYDVVTYFTMGKPVKGSKKFEMEWQDAKWRFSSADNLNRFRSDPQKYAPQYGGY